MANEGIKHSNEVLGRSVDGTELRNFKIKDTGSLLVEVGNDIQVDIETTPQDPMYVEVVGGGMTAEKLKTTLAYTTEIDDTNSLTFIPSAKIHTLSVANYAEEASVQVELKNTGITLEVAPNMIVDFLVQEYDFTEYEITTSETDPVKLYIVHTEVV